MYVMNYSEPGTQVSVLHIIYLKVILGSTLGALPHEARGGVFCLWCHFGSLEVSELGHFRFSGRYPA